MGLVPVTGGLGGIQPRGALLGPGGQHPGPQHCFHLRRLDGPAPCPLGRPPGWRCPAAETMRRKGYCHAYYRSFTPVLNVAGTNHRSRQPSLRTPAPPRYAHMDLIILITPFI